VSYPELETPLRTALVGVSGITTRLSAYKGSFPVFTRRPVPSDAPYPMIIVSPDIVKDDDDGLSDSRPIITRDISVYGQNDKADKYDNVQAIGRLIHDLFHRKRGAITVPGWNVTSITAHGPIPAPVDDDQTVARMVTLSIQLSSLTG